MLKFPNISKVCITLDYLKNRKMDMVSAKFYLDARTIKILRH